MKNWYIELLQYLEIQYLLNIPVKQGHPINFLPPYSPDLNATERVWWYMHKKITHNRFIKTLKEREIEFWKMFSHFQKHNEKLKVVCEINY